MWTRFGTTLTLALAAVFFARPISAQWSVAPTVAMGISLPTGTLGDAVSEGIAFKAGLWMRAPRLPVGFTAEAMHAQFGDAGSTASRERIRLSAVTTNITTRRHERRLDLYAVAGGGWYWMQGSREPFAARHAPGINIGVGEIVALGTADYFVELRVHAIRTSSRTDAQWMTFMPLLIGVRF